MHRYPQQYEHEAFIQHIQDQQTLKLIHNQKFSKNYSKASANLQKQQKYPNTQFPHYWPADKVPFLGITFCECFQYAFAVLFIAVLIWIFVGLKHFGEQNQIIKGVKTTQKAEIKQAQENKDLVQNQNTILKNGVQKSDHQNKLLYQIFGKIDLLGESPQLIINNQAITFQTPQQKK